MSSDRSEAKTERTAAEYLTTYCQKELIKLGWVKAERLQGILEGLESQLNNLPWWHNPASIPRTPHELEEERNLFIKINLMKNVLGFLDIKKEDKK